jgi:hypothetical protein
VEVRHESKKARNLDLRSQLVLFAFFCFCAVANGEHHLPTVCRAPYAAPACVCLWCTLQQGCFAQYVLAYLPL